MDKDNHRTKTVHGQTRIGRYKNRTRPGQGENNSTGLKKKRHRKLMAKGPNRTRTMK
jgi:hypothetical protein